MIKRLKNRRGITLIELVITLAILSMVFAVGYNFFSSALHSFGSQRDNVDNQARARQVMRDMSKEIRKISWEATIEIEAGKSIKIDDISYTFQKNNNTLLKNGKVFVTGIQSFNPRWDYQNNKKAVILEITTLANTGHEITLSSSIHVRE